jgi:Tol biopolymer transport system component
MMKVSCLVLALILLSVACSSSTELENPPWVWKLIVQFQLQPVGNPPQSIWRYEWEGRTVYYIPPQCCDVFSSLYDAEGTLICAPNGGIDGRGDGRCPNFLTERTNERLVWEDIRAR